MYDVFSTKFAQDIYKQKYSMDGVENWEDTARRVVDNVCGQLLSKEDQEAIYNIILERKFIPGGRYLYSSGRQFHQVNNCFLFRATDSREGWADASYKTTMALMTGGGIGFDYSQLREEGAKIRKTGGTSTGPIALIKMINELGRYIMQGGARRCLSEDSLVFTEKGIIPIKDIQIGDKVYTTEGLQIINNKFKQGKQWISKIETTAGNFYATPNHKMAVLSDNGSIKWKMVKELTEDDFLIHFNNIIKGQKTNLPEDFTQNRPDMSTTCKNINIPKLDSEIAWYLGLFHGDGYVLNRQNSKYNHWVKGNSSKITTSHFSNDLNSINKAAQILSSFCENVQIKDKKNEKCTQVTVYSQRLSEYFEKYIKQPHTSIDVPNFIKKGTVEIRGAYLAGLVDSDGAINNRPVHLLTTVYPDFARQIQSIYSSLGIPTRLKITTPKEDNWQTKYNICLIGFREQYNKYIGKYSTKGLLPNKGKQQGFFVPKRVVKNLLQDKDYRGKWNATTSKGMNYETFLECNGNLPGIPVKIKNIDENHDEVETYDIEVENKHEFFSDGLLTHNSAIWAGLNWQHLDIHKFLELKNWPDTIKSIKEKDLNFPVPMELTNISVIYDTEFFIAIEDKKHPLHKQAKEVWDKNCLQSFSTAEPGMSFNFRKDNESLRNACTEVVSEDDSDKCNLGTVWINRINNEDEFAYVVKYATKFLLCGGIYSNVPTDQIKEIGIRNNRIGLGLGGIHEWLMSRGHGYQCVPELHKWLSIYEHESDSTAFITARKLNVSIPKGVRAIAPTGTIGILAETTTGIEPLFCKAYKRRYLQGKDWVYQYVVDGAVKRLLDNGIKQEHIQDSFDISFKERVKFQADVQNYVDMAISSTCNLPTWGSELNNEETLKKYSKLLLKYAKRLRGFTCYPDGVRSGQPLTRVTLNTALNKEGVVYEETESECLNGVCGV